MIQLEDRLTGHFQLEAGALAEHISPVGDLGAVKARARQRTRNRGLATAAAGLIALTLGAAVAVRLVDRDPTLRIETLGHDDASREQGLPTGTGPVLQWVDLGTDAFEARSSVWTGEYFVVFGYRVANTGVGGPSIGGLYRSADGDSWELVTEPLGNENFHNVELWSDGAGTVLAWSNTASTDAITRVLLSDDHGRTFTDIGSFAISDPDGGPFRDIAQAFGMAVVNGNIYAAVNHSADLDLAALVESAGDADLAARIRVGEVGLGYGLGPDGLSVCIDTNCENTELIALDETNLSPDLWARLQAEMQGGRIGIALLTPGEAPVVVDTWNGRAVSGLLTSPVGSTGGHRLAVAVGVSELVDGEPSTHSRLHTSSDGETWAESDLAVDAFGVWFDDEGALIASYHDDVPHLDRSTDGGVTWTPVAPAAGHRFTVGPAGMLVEGTTGAEQARWPGYAIAKDHYRLEVTEETAVLVDTDSGTRLAEAGRKEDSSWLIEREAEGDNDQWTLTVLHPDTGEELMVITEDDLGELGAPDAAAGSEAPMLGWSIDGETWGWQTYGQAFGPAIEDDQRRGNEPIQLVVGSDRVLALVPPPYVAGLEPVEESIASDAGEEAEASSTVDGSHLLSRVFVAEVP
ncbi:MAG: hypothetical protein OEW83_01640 [Acidimicrobiia bacterium]|nr:hypothetical protein [Acidimicrobiia bacterium]